MKRKPLNQLATIRSGYPFRGRIKHEPEGRVRVLQIRDLRLDPKLESNDPLWVSDSAALKKHHLQAGDIVIPARGDYRQAVLFGFQEPAVASSQMLILRVRDPQTSQEVLPAFLCWALNQPTAQQVLELAARGTSMPLLTRASLGALPIPLPSLATQEKIIALQQLWETEHGLLQKLTENRASQIQGMMQHLINQDTTAAKPTAEHIGVTP